jgi:hypothetical protein
MPSANTAMGTITISVLAALISGVTPSQTW